MVKSTKAALTDFLELLPEFQEISRVNRINGDTHHKTRLAWPVQENYPDIDRVNCADSAFIRFETATTSSRKLSRKLGLDCVWYYCHLTPFHFLLFVKRSLIEIWNLIRTQILSVWKEPLKQIFWSKLLVPPRRVSHLYICEVIFRRKAFQLHSWKIYSFLKFMKSCFHKDCFSPKFISSERRAPPLLIWVFEIFTQTLQIIITQSMHITPNTKQTKNAAKVVTNCD